MKTIFYINDSDNTPEARRDLQAKLFNLGYKWNSGFTITVNQNFYYIIVQDGRMRRGGKDHFVSTLLPNLNEEYNLYKYIPSMHVNAQYDKFMWETENKLISKDKLTKQEDYIPYEDRVI